jgi:hypothetical protein
VDKRHILEEIRRTAEQNGGVALGRERFFQETGIKESDWLGKIWARWGDAVNEAGCTPNTLTTPIAEQTLMEHYIATVRELGRFPVVAELKLKSKATPGFPSHNTFRRLGNKAELVQKTVDYCGNHSERSEVLEIAK